MEIRRARADEWQELRALRLEALTTTPTAFAATLAEEQALSDDAWQERARLNAGDDVPCFVAEEAGGLVGMAVGKEDDAHPRRAWLLGMYVRREVRGRGVGEALVQAVLAWTKAKGADDVVLEVNVDQRGAVRLYERCGFVDTGVRGPMRSGHGTQTRMLRR
jgi:GNAT superfamily N-acetyltransferase